MTFGARARVIAELIERGYNIGTIMWADLEQALRRHGFIIVALPQEKRDDRTGDPVGSTDRPQEYDDAHIAAFVGTMRAKLRKHAHKGPWDDEDPMRLFLRLAGPFPDSEMNELYRAIQDEDADAIRAESADCGNFAMMLHSLADRIVARRENRDD